MSLTTILLAPLLALLPAAGTIDGRPEVGSDPVAAGASPGAAGDRLSEPALSRVPPEAAQDLAENSPFLLVVESLREEQANQVRIEQRMTIRVSPRPAPVQRNMLADLPGREVGPHFEERKIGKCLPVSNIAGVQTQGANQLLLFTRDQRIVRAELERACRARDFYSGFYLSRSSDGRLCVDRDTLLSRSGANCKLTRIRQLVEAED